MLFLIMGTCELITYELHFRIVKEGNTKKYFYSIIIYLMYNTCIYVTLTLYVYVKHCHFNIDNIVYYIMHNIFEY